MKKITFIITLLVIAIVSANAAKLQRYVTVNGAGSKNGTSWANAATDITLVMNDLTFDDNYVVTDGGDVFVAAGTYNAPENGFRMIDKINVYGGFPAAGGSVRDWKTNKTILDGKANNTRLILQGENSPAFTDYCVWDGFILQNGKAGNGAGALLTLKGVLSNCIIRNCDATNGYAIGGAVQSKKNTTAGAAVTGATLYNCLLINNISGKATVNFNTAPAYMIYTTVANNKTTGICGIGSPLVATDITATGMACAGVVLDNWAHWSIGFNNIIWGNEGQTTAQLVSQNGGIKVFHSSVIEGKGLAIDAAKVTTRDSIITDPIFVRPTSFKGLAVTTEQLAELEAADFHVQSTSPCIGKAKVEDSNFGAGKVFNLIPSVDLAGNARVGADGKADMGAYQTGGTTGFTKINEIQFRVSIIDQLCLINGLQHNDKIKIYSINGKQLYAGTSAVETMFIDATHFGKGILLVSVERGGDSYSQKVMNK